MKEGNTVSGLEVRAEEKDGTNGGFSGYTQKDGMFYSLKEQDGSELDLTLTGKRAGDGKQITRKLYHLSRSRKNELLQDKLGMVVLAQSLFYPYPKTKKKLHAVVQLFSFALFF